MNNKKTIATLLILSLVISASVAFADSVGLRYIGVEDISIGLSINTDNKASCCARVNSSASNYAPFVSATLKRSSDGKIWTSVASWSASGTFLTGASIDETVAVSRGFQYKLFVTDKIYNSSGALIETVYKNSRIVSHY